MRLKEITDQTRRDFWGVYECEKCQYQQTIKGYDDDYYHQQVTPSMRCSACGESTNSLGAKPLEIKTKYEAHQVV